MRGHLYAGEEIGQRIGRAILCDGFELCDARLYGSLVENARIFIEQTHGAARQQYHVVHRFRIIGMDPLEDITIERDRRFRFDRALHSLKFRASGG
jgi:hypothetical protein